jgi:hypothetical protein
MISCTLTTALFALFATAVPVFGDSPLIREWSGLQEQRDKALATAADTINHNYKAAVEALLRRATQSNDLEAAQVLRAEIAKLGGDVLGKEGQAQGTAADALTNQLVNTKWIWYSGETLTFLPDGKAKWSLGDALWPWKITNAGRRVIEGVNMSRGTKFTITFDHNLKTGAIEGDGGTRKTGNITGQ